MKVNSEAIYATHASPFGIPSWGRCTMKKADGNTILYLSVFDWPKDGKLTLPGLNQPVKSAILLAGGQELKTEIKNDNLEISVPGKAPDNIASVIKVTVAGDITKIGESK